MSLIGNGKDTRLWLNNWHPNGVLIKSYGERIRYDAGSDRLCKVNTILHEEDWRPGPASSHSLMEAWRVLHLIDRLGTTEKDTVVWKENSNGIFSTKSAWNLIIREIGTKLEWSKVVWCRELHPKAQLSLLESYDKKSFNSNSPLQNENTTNLPVLSMLEQ